MDRQYIKDNQVIERYLRNRLSEEEAAAFEEFYLSDPETLEELELAEGLQKGMRDLSSSGYFRSAVLRRIFLSPQYAAAASLLALVGLVTSSVLFQDRQSVEYASGTTRIVPIVATRGAATPANVLKAGVAGEWVVLLVDPGEPSYDSYRADVARVMAKGPVSIWTADGLELGYQEQLALSLPGETLRPGSYRVRVDGHTANRYDLLTRIEFRIAEPQR